MLDAATKLELIKEITSLPESLPDLPDGRDAEDQKQIDEVLRLLAKANAIIRQLIEHEERRKLNWAETVEAIEAARRGETKSFASADEMMAWLHADDDADA
jgi:hypothetical protein